MDNSTATFILWYLYCEWLCFPTIKSFGGLEQFSNCVKIVSDLRHYVKKMPSTNYDRKGHMSHYCGK